MTVAQAMKKYRRNDSNTRIYVRELETEEYRGIYKYYDSEVVRIYPYNGDMVCEVAKEVK